MVVGILGLGYWGPNLARNFLSQKEVTKVIGCDQKDERLKFIANRFPSIHLINDCEELMNGEADIIVIATPVDTHYKFAKKALESGKHIWVEKPFTSSSAQAEELIELAERKNLKIFVDHTFIYNGAVRKMKELVEGGELGSVLYFDSERINLGLFQRDVNVVWDLAPHDISIMNFILPKHEVTAVSASGIANFNGKENLAHLIVGGDRKMLVYDDMENFEKIKVYDSGVEFKSTESIHQALVQYRIGDMFSPKISQTEALALGANEFISAIQEDRTPLTSGKDGLDVVRILEASDKSIKNNGEIVELNTNILI
jgi:predicted dehydrogenase